ncbi:YtpI family protein [Bacillus sp. EB600]|uniref:YtpI family protein n=1 Tax=Bacillus sp. EB600 TaxID=2806345 RepID=UPI00210CD053|nr:YtpI family protein [Bacillus sp. EB600]MCQ6278361.1 YtpI family protein [Bacillus sp. EB600]
MPVLVVLIVIFFTFYLFYKIKYVRSNRPAEKKWLSSKSRIALGLFVCLFGINQLFLYHTMITYIVAAIFILMGGLSALSGVKAYKYYLPYAEKEAEHIEE